MEKIIYMKIALKEAYKAYKKGDVPVGAVIVCNNKVIAKAHNKKERKQNSLFHAEILAINKACKKNKSFRLDNCELYVTLEPCLMCCGAIIASRFKKVIYGARDFNYGCAGSKYDFLQDKAFEYKIPHEGGVLEKECSELIKTFFSEIRKKKRKK